MTFRFPTGSHRALLLILFAAFILRFWGIGFGLPHLYHADEPIVVNHALAYSTGDFNPHFFRIPPLVSYLLFFVYGLCYLGGQAAGFFQSPQDFEMLFYADPSFFYFMGRLTFGVIPGTLSVAALWFCVRRFFDERTAVLSAFLFSVSFLHVRDSHYIYADIPLILVMILSWVPLLLLVEKNTLKNHLSAGAMMGLAAAVKYNGVFLALPFLLTSILGRPSERSWFRHFLFVCVAGGVCCGVFFLLNPYAFLDWRFFLREIAGESQARAQGTGLLHHLTYSLTGALGLPHLILSLLGLAGFSQFTKNSRLTMRRVMTGFVFFYYAVLVWAGQPYDRYALPLLPFMAFFAADAVLKFSEYANRFSRPALLILICLTSAFPLAKTVLVNRIFTAKDIRTEAKEWIETNIPPGSKIAMDTKFYMPPLSFSSAALNRKRDDLNRIESSGPQGRRLEALIRKDENEQRGYDLYFLHDEPFPESPFMMWGPFLPFDLEALKEAGIQYLVLTAFQKLQPEESSKFRRIKVFSPYRDATRTEPFDHEALTGAPFLWSELWNRSRNGQPIVLFELMKQGG